MKNIFLNPAVIGMRVIMYLFLCLLIGGIYWEVGDKFTHESVLSRTSLLFYLSAFLIFMSIAALPAFMMERAIFEKEINNKLYHPLIYQYSSWIVSWIGVGIISLLSTICVIYMANINGFIIFFLTLLFSLLIAEGIVTLIAVIVTHYIIGMALVAGIYGFFMVCEGFLVTKNDMPPWFKWGYYIAFHSYSLRVFMRNEFSDIERFDKSSFKNGNDVLMFYNMDDVNITNDLFILLSYIILIQILISLVMIIKYVRI